MDAEDPLAWRSTMIPSHLETGDNREAPARRCFVSQECRLLGGASRLTLLEPATCSRRFPCTPISLGRPSVGGESEG